MHGIEAKAKREAPPRNSFAYYNAVARRLKDFVGPNH
jgi:hypothetical protein